MSLDLTSDPYALISVDLGETPKTFGWFQPPYEGTTPEVATQFDGPAQMGITVSITAASADDLQTAIDDVISEFSTANTITFSLGGTPQTIYTYPSNIAPLDLALENLYIAVNKYRVPAWTFQVWRQPYIV